MHNQSRAYHVGYESARACQAQMRAMRAQDRLARQARAARPAGAPRSIAALLHRLGSGLWAMGRRAASRDGLDAVSQPDAAIAHP